MKLEYVLDEKFDGLFVKLPLRKSPFNKGVISVLNDKAQIIDEYGNLLEILSDNKDGSNKYVFIENENPDGSIQKFKKEIIFLDVFITGVGNCKNVNLINLDGKNIFSYVDKAGNIINEYLKEDEEVFYLVEFTDKLQPAIELKFNPSKVELISDELFSKVSAFNKDGDEMFSKTIIADSNCFVEITGNSIINDMEKDEFEMDNSIINISEFIDNRVKNVELEISYAIEEGFF